MATFISNSPDETKAFGRRFAEGLKPGDVLALTGELGSGKTQFVKGLVAGLGSTAEVTSPTFTLIHEYTDGPIPIYHFDFFRLEDRQRSRREPDDVDGKAREGLRAGTRANQSGERLGLDDYFFGDGVSVIEWADKFPDLIPETARWISFETKSETQRAITAK
ncbi:MAG TPA: tRNA (adenosine(37)-N6)-threonylcarbamoyltransferase complex ATPase subunit type 1 TsaE [Chthoniobacterales bacterium]|nr:tRNA (adenosine(37)-N6)-threonylcarbamoyltransferase complex ATPase subunit type 1 TsaE [Chthoniobacterales bacterium]